LLSSFLAASGWFGLVVKLVADHLKEMKDRQKANQMRLLALAHRLNDTPLNEIRHMLETGKPEPSIDAFTRRNLASFLEDVALECRYDAITYEQAYETYGELTLKCEGDEGTWEGESAESKEKYWRVFFDFSKRMKEFQRRHPKQ
jgi:hypothetical protein